MTDPPAQKSALVVEDDELLRATIEKALDQAGIQVTCVTYGRAAMSCAIANTFDVILLDLHLPDMTGQDVITSLALHGIKVPFVVMTGQGNERLAVEMMKFGASDYLVKDHNLPHVLPGAITRTLRAVESERLLRKAEQALMENEKRFRSLFQNIPGVAVQGYSANGTITYWNRASETLYGYSPREAIGRTIFDLIIPAPLHEDVAQSIQHMVATSKPIAPSELNMRRKDGSTVTVLSSHAILHNAKEEPELFCIDIDLTARLEAELEHEKLQVQLTQAQKLEAVGRLAGGVAHDFNNMLGVICGHTELLINKAVDADEATRESLHEIRKAAQRSADLTRQLLAFARKQNTIPKVLDLNTAVESMLKMLRRLIGESMQLLWEPGNNIGNIRMDPSQIDQILANLCVNARDAIHDTGTITMQTTTQIMDDEQCLLHADSSPGAYVRLTIEDNGCGMDAETLANIFEPFYTTKSIEQGTGLGLATVYGIVRQNHGFIAVTSEPGNGTTFDVYLPRFTEAPDSPEPEQTGDLEPSGKELILLVEDNQALLDMISTMLRRTGHQILPARNPREAIALARETKTQIDLVVTDVIMPEMNGRTLFGHIAQMHPEARCLFMSGYTADAISRHGVLNEGVHFIQKPFAIRELVAKIREVMQKSHSTAAHVESD